MVKHEHPVRERTGNVVRMRLRHEIRDLAKKNGSGPAARPQWLLQADEVFAVFLKDPVTTAANYDCGLSFRCL